MYDPSTPESLPPYPLSSTNSESYGAVPALSQRRSTSSASSYASGYAAASPLYTHSHAPASPLNRNSSNNGSSYVHHHQHNDNSSNDFKPAQLHHKFNSGQPLLYPYNARIALFYIPTLLAWNSSLIDSRPRVSLGIVFIWLYLFDLMRVRQGLLASAWTMCFMQAFVTLWTRLLAIDDAHDKAPTVGSGYGVLMLLSLTGIEAMQWACGACWLSLQMQWLLPSHDSSSKNNTSSIYDGSSSLPTVLAQTLHGMLPVVSSAMLTYCASIHFPEVYGRDWAARVLPLGFALVLAVGMGFLSGNTENIWDSDNSNNANDNGSSVKSPNEPRALVTRMAVYLQLLLLLLLPGVMHVCISMGRIASSYASWDDIYDLLLAVIVPILLWQCLIVATGGTKQSPFTIIQATKQATIGMIAILVASLSCQQRYLIPICQRFAFYFTGTTPPSWLVALYWTFATSCSILVVWLWNRPSRTNQDQLFLGEYHEDIIQLLLASTGAALAKAFGLAWNFVPLPVLAFLGFALWLTTRMLRYLSIFLFVLHATGVVVFTYRFAGMTTQTLQLPMPILPSLSLLRFGVVAIATSIGIGIVMGLSVRSNGGLATSIVRRFDLTGLLLITYSIMLMALEITLLKQPEPSHELVGIIMENDQESSVLYTHVLMLITSAVTIGITIFMKRVRILSERTAGIVTALAIGKAVATYIDMMEEADSDDDVTPPSVVFRRALAASLVGVIMFAPRIFLQPVHLKTSVRYQRSLSANGKQGALPAGTSRTVVLYATLVLPLTLSMAVPFVLLPLANAVNGRAELLETALPLSELVGSIVSLWGLSCLSMLNYYLPDGGGEKLKKLSAIAFLAGAGLFFVAPSIKTSVPLVANNPYVAISTRGTQLLSHNRHRTGGWGLLSASMATLLAIAGPLQLKERRLPAGRKDRYLLFRCMVFSLMFGGGVAWFIILLSMTESDWLYLVLSCLACMTIAFLGTICSVLGYFIELENFFEVESLSRMFFVAIPLFTPVTGLQQLLQSEKVHPFGSGGWMSTYLTVCCVFTLGYTIALRSRKAKSPSTRGIGNSSCLVAWICAVTILYGRYGVSGLNSDYEITSFFGVSAPVIETILLSVILLLLQGEKTPDSTRSRITSERAGARHAGIILPSLTQHNKCFPCLAGSVLVFIVASLYAIFLRGSGFPWMFGLSMIPESHGDILHKALGGSATHTNLATLVRQTVAHSQALMASAKLAGSGLWTAPSLIGPLIHLAGLVATLPSFLLQSIQWWWHHTPSTSSVVLAFPPNLIPLLLCRGLPPLQAIAIINVLVSGFQLIQLRNSNQELRMSI